MELTHQASYFAAASPEGPAPMIATREIGLYEPIVCRKLEYELN